MRERFLPSVYIMASQRNGTLYTGVTSDPVKRIWEHREEVGSEFTRKYSVKRLVWLELHETMETAIQREKRIKKWNRTWKLELIEKSNPEWNDLYDQMVQDLR